MNLTVGEPDQNDIGNDDYSIEISKSSYELAKNLRSHLGHESACKTCEQNHWNGVLAALHFLNSKK